MTDVDRFESRFEARLLAHAASVRRSFDAAATARAAIDVASAQRARRRWAWLVRDVEASADDVVPSRSAWTGATIGLLLALLAMLVLAAVFVGGRTSEPSPQPEPIAPPLAGAFAATGDLNAKRSQHVAVPLLDGRVLVLGGDWDGTGYLPAELYDPATGRFTTIELPALRRGVNDADMFTATVLTDGRVLIAGGQVEPFDGPPVPRTDALLFDPGSMTVAATGPMTIGRNGHAAARLPDGRVLLAGGLGREPDGMTRSLASAELYDPTTGTFIPTGSMATGRSADLSFPLDTVALHSGRILIRGGAQAEFGPDGTGEWRAVDVSDEVYDPDTGQFEPVSALGSREADPAAILFQDGRIQRYDLRSGSATDITPELPETIREFGPHCIEHEWTCRLGWTLTLLDDGRVLLTGGWDTLIEPPGAGRRWRRAARTVAEVFDPSLGVSVPTGLMLEPRVAHSATLLADGRVLVIGGERTRSDPDTEPRVWLSSAEVYTPAP